jgi:hypothetical protein
MSKVVWEDNGVQFPRLLAELRAAGITPEQMKFLSKSMDLNEGDLESLFLRAEDEWEKIKKDLVPSPRR